MSVELLCTLGPSSLREGVIRRLSELGVSLLRINLSHTRLEDLEGWIRLVRGCTRTPLCLDTEGAQVRTGHLVEGSVTVRENALLRAHRRPVPGDAHDFNLYPQDIVERLEIGDFLTVDFNSLLLRVVEKAAGQVTLRALHGGVMGRNKAVTVERDLPLPAFTPKDLAALALGRELGVRHVALSFVHRAADVKRLRMLMGGGVSVISKIECRGALQNLDAIIAASDAILIDRGDLSREVPIERIPREQKRILRRAKEAGVKAYVATNLLESMTASAVPTRAEVNDVYNTLADGADGLVLAAETAIGAYPVECASMVVKLAREFEHASSPDADARPDGLTSLLVEPHGGLLVSRLAREEDLTGLRRLKALQVRETDLMDCERIAEGTYSPLTGFMDRETLESVLQGYRLPDATAWPMPVLLQVSRSSARGIGPGERLRLEDSRGRAFALLDVRQVYGMDLELLARKWFSTASARHPGAARLRAGGDRFIGGEVRLLRPLPSPYRGYILTPVQSRFLFTHKGWSRVVGFHTRNVVHRVHEYLQLSALESARADGLYVSPVIGPKKSGDFLPDPIMKSYQLMLDFGLYPKGKVALGCFPTYSRYCGPREAVFTALCRKNMGCSHFIVGRDHTGVGDFYPPRENRRLFDRLGDIGVTPIFFDAVGYDARRGTYGPVGAGGDGRAVSGTRARRALCAGRPLPEWFMRGMIQDMLRSELRAKRPVFCG